MEGQNLSMRISRPAGHPPEQVSQREGWGRQNGVGRGETWQGGGRNGEEVAEESRSSGNGEGQILYTTSPPPLSPCTSPRSNSEETHCKLGSLQRGKVFKSCFPSKASHLPLPNWIQCAPFLAQMGRGRIGSAVLYICSWE